MEKLPMCRICLVENVRMYVVVNRTLHELYEKLTDIPFVTEDRRPILACFFCCHKLKQCCRLLRQCLEAEELFAQMMNEDYEPNSLINQDCLEFYSGFIKSPMVHVSIVDECQPESISIKEELSAVSEGLDVIIEPNEEHQSDEQEPENLDNSCLNVADIPPHYSESDLEDDVPLMELKAVVVETERATVAKKPKLDTRRTKLEDAIITEQTKNANSESKVIRLTQKHKPGTYYKEPSQCDHRSFNQIKQLLIQNTSTQIGEKLKCDVCQRSFNQMSHLANHICKHTAEKPYKCNVCPHSFRRNRDLTIHFRIHTGAKPYKCDVCQHRFNQKSHLTSHIRIHTGAKPYKCDVCQRSFSIKDVLTKHIRIHTGEKPYKCDVCQHSFIQKSNLIQHIRIHTGEKRHKCDVCQRSFNHKSNLTEHYRKHTGEKPYKCDVCQRSFIQKTILKNHIRIHTGEKPYKCDVCQRRFSLKGILTKHIRIHTGEKPYKCDVCHRRFRQKDVLSKHIICIHTGEKL